MSSEPTIDSCATQAGLLIEVQFATTVNYAMQQNDVPLIRSIRLRNATTEDIERARVRLWTEPEIIAPQDRIVESIRSGCAAEIEDLKPRLLRRPLIEHSEREIGELCIEVLANGRVVASRRDRITVLAFNEWDATAPLPELTAAFVLPNDPAAEIVLIRARKILSSGGEWGGLDGYQSKDARKVWRTAAAIYEAISALDIGYTTPPASFERTGQKVRTPSQILESRLATCLDLVFLFSACCEQAGLRSLVTRVRGHALAGVWLVPSELPSASVGHASDLRKRIALGEMLSLELTGLCRKPAMSFVQACHEADRRLENDSDFQSSLDVAMARSAGIRPLPLSASDADKQQVGCAVQGSDPVLKPEQLEPPPGWCSPQADPASARQLDSPAETPNQRLRRWKQRLLDLTLRNRLLNYKDTKRSIPILCPEIGRLEDALSVGAEFRLKARPEVMGTKDPRDAALHRERTGQDALEEYLKSELDQKRLHADLSMEDLSSRLIEIDRAFRLSLEEGGANTLYLALGFLRWYETDTSDKELVAPILLLPMRIERSSLREGFRLRKQDEEPRINITLLKRLEQNGVLVEGLDPLPEDSAGLDVQVILDHVRRAIIGQPRWDVADKAALCILTFSKFLMWIDLEKNAPTLLKNAVVRHLVETPNEAFDQAEFPDERKLDDRYRAADTYCPVDADASQLSAVFAASERRSFVLQGPPGTGKSQTITNIVAQTLAAGRRVLFVSQKMAALNVVHARLSSVGLGPFCLELHSTKATKDSVRRQLKEAVNATDDAFHGSWETEAARLEGLRRALNLYVRALHAERPAGMTAFQALSTLIGLEKASEVTLTLGPLDGVDRASLTAMRSAIMSLKQMASEARLEPGHPLRAVNASRWTISLPEEARDASSSVLEAVAALREAQTGVIDALGLALELQPDYLFASSFVDLLESSPAPSSELLAEPAWAEIRPRLQSSIALGRSRDSKRAAILRAWSDAFLKADHAAFLGVLAKSRSAGFLVRFFLRRRVRRGLALLRRDGQPPSLVSAEADLKDAVALKKETALLSDSHFEGARLFGPPWKGGEANWIALEAQLAWADRFRSAFGGPTGASCSPELKSRLVAIASAKDNPFRPGGPLHANGQKFRGALEYLEKTVESFRRLLEATSGPWDGPEASYLAGVERDAKQVLQNLDRLRDWCGYQDARQRLAALGLRPLADALHRGDLSISQLQDAFEKSFARWLFGAAAEAEPVLAEFHGAQHGATIEEFRSADERLRDMTQRIVLARLREHLTGLQSASDRDKSTEGGRLQRFITGGRTSIRRLFQECGRALALYKPCVLMSPLSVAQFLGPEFPAFDLVVFDEASQMPPWEAVGAIARGQQLVVVGDSKQLPPTTFFERKSDDNPDPDGNEEVIDEESILDECVGAQIRTLTLKWHYRSRHESLIAFSNQRYYDGRLLTFPSAVAKSPRLGVSWTEVSGGVYESGASRRTNRGEADALVADVIRRASDPLERARTLGIVTFSISQQNLVEDLLEQARARHPEVESLFTREREPLFIKNLETVQGDERDVILFSICYGPDAQGRVALRFGPLNAKGGQRRLNVAITRARQQLVVFSTLRPEQIDLSRAGADGVKDLKAFLDYARRGPVALEEQSNASLLASCESPFEQVVYDSLTAKGWSLHKQVGCSGYRIDLAVIDPDNPGQYILGVECDGANYHSSPTARDRDRLRASVLAGLGWRLHRIWSTDWWQDAARQLEKVDAAIRDALHEHKADRARLAGMSLTTSLAYAYSNEQGRAW